PSAPGLVALADRAILMPWLALVTLADPAILSPWLAFVALADPAILPPRLALFAQAWRLGARRARAAPLAPSALLTARHRGLPPALPWPAAAPLVPAAPAVPLTSAPVATPHASACSSCGVGNVHWRRLVSRRTFER